MVRSCRSGGGGTAKAFYNLREVNNLYSFISDPDWSDEEPTVANSSRSSGDTAKALYNLREGPKKTYVDEPTGDVTCPSRRQARLSTFFVGLCFSPDEFVVNRFSKGMKTT